MRIIYVHGIGKQKTPRKLKYLWDKALNLSERDRELSKMAYWSDIQYPSILDEKDSLDESLFSDLSNELSDEIMVDALQGFSKAFMKDVHDYLFDEEKRKLIQYRLINILDELDEPCVIIGHSLGSLIAYEVLQSYEMELKVPLLLTIGSPLGIDFIEAYLRDRGETDFLYKPWPVKRWYNFSDPLDIVAADKSVSDDYIGKGIRDKIITNPDQCRTDMYGPHSGTGYLSHPKVRDAVQGALPLDNPIYRFFYELFR